MSSVSVRLCHPFLRLDSEPTGAHRRRSQVGHERGQELATAGSGYCVGDELERVAAMLAGRCQDVWSPSRRTGFRRHIEFRRSAFPGLPAAESLVPQRC